MMIFSKKVCEKLEIVKMQDSENSRNMAVSAKEKCDCPIRSKTPDPPKEIPFSPTDENVPKLEAWILDHYKGSAFNVCPHQPLQQMTGKPLGITFKEGAVPKAVHTPVPVPYHWKSRVKEDLDRDVRLGIIEKVPQNCPVNWLSRMVIAPKPSSGEPR